jgi:hypothetical protein
MLLGSEARASGLPGREARQKELACLRQFGRKEMAHRISQEPLNIKQL